MIATEPPRPSRRPLVSFTLSGVLAVFFVAWTWLSAGQESALHHFDHECAEFWRDRDEQRGAEWETMVFLTGLGSIPTMCVVAVMGALWQSSIGRRALGAAWLAIVVGGGLLNMALKTNLNRDRPPQEWRDRSVLERNQSYPSGHAMGSAIGYGMLGYCLLLQTRGRDRRLAVRLFLAVLIAGVGFSRIYLRAHWFSDVIGGYAVGLAWLFLWTGFLEQRRLRAEAVTGGSVEAARTERLGGEGGHQTDDTHEAEHDR
jgi:undecaprenyl-diphosphatase